MIIFQDIAKSPVDEAGNNVEGSICETTPLRHEEATESTKSSNTKSGRLLDTKSIIEEEQLPPNRTEPGECIDAKNIISSKSNVTKSEDTENTVIQKQTSSSQDLTGDTSSSSRSPEIKESGKTDITSSRTESIKKAKARFLESDI